MATLVLQFFKLADEEIVVSAWWDKRPVCTMASCHTTLNTVQQRKARFIEQSQVAVPEFISAYNKHMGGVDKGDAARQYYGFPHSSKKWYHHMELWAVDICVLNARRTLAVHTGQPMMTGLDFRLHLIDNLLDYADIYAKKEGSFTRMQPPVALTERYRKNLALLTEHKLRYVPMTKGRDKRRQCRAMIVKHDDVTGRPDETRSRCKKRVNSQCPGCGDVAMCAGLCFVAYHTELRVRLQEILTLGEGQPDHGQPGPSSGP